MDQYRANWKLYVTVHHAGLSNREGDDDAVLANDFPLLYSLVNVLDANVRKYLRKLLERFDDVQSLVPTWRREFSHVRMIADFLRFAGDTYKLSSARCVKRS